MLTVPPTKDPLCNNFPMTHLETVFSYIRRIYYSLIASFIRDTTWEKLKKKSKRKKPQIPSREAYSKIPSSRNYL